jgi:endo-1,4-beta-mannosidase
MAFIQKYIIYILAGIVAVMAITSGIMYMRVLSNQATIKEQKGTIILLDKSLKSKEATISEYKKNNEAIAKTQKAQEKIAVSMKELETRIANMQPTKCLEVEDEKVFTDITNAYNGRKLPQESN